MRAMDSEPTYFCRGDVQQAEACGDDEALHKSESERPLQYEQGKQRFRELIEPQNFSAGFDSQATLDEAGGRISGQCQGSEQSAAEQSELQSLRHHGARNGGADQATPGLVGPQQPRSVAQRDPEIEWGSQVGAEDVRCCPRGGIRNDEQQQR